MSPALASRFFTTEPCGKPHVLFSPDTKSVQFSSVAQSCPTLCDPMDCSLPDSSIHGFSRQEYWSGVPLPSPVPASEFSSIAQSCLTLCNPMNRSTPGLPVHHQLPEFTQTLIHRIGDAIQPSHLLSSPSPSAPNPSQQQSLFQ